MSAGMNPPAQAIGLRSAYNQSHALAHQKIDGSFHRPMKMFSEAKGHFKSVIIALRCIAHD
jgi:hypothetical protein